MGNLETMAASGIKPTGDCAPKWELVKSPKGEEDGEKVRGFTFGFNAKRTEINPIHRIGKTLDDDGNVTEETLMADWQKFLDLLPPKDAIYCAYEFEYKDRKSGYNDGDEDSMQIKAKLVLISWAPDNAKPQVKMLVPSSLAGLKDVCAGVQFSVQANCLDDLGYEEVMKKLNC